MTVSSRAFPVLKESVVRRISTPTALNVGTMLSLSGFVGHRLYSSQEPLIHATVQESQQRYHVTVQHMAGEEFVAQCQCPNKGLCSHAIAVLLCWARESYSFVPTAHTSESLTSPQAMIEQQWLDQLQHRTVNQLRAIAQRHQIRLRGNDRAGILTQTAKLLADPATQVTALRQLSSAERDVLSMLFVLSDGTPDTRALDLQAALGVSTVEEIDISLQELTEWGLIISDHTQWHRFIPYTLAPGVAENMLQTAQASLTKEAEGHSKLPRMAIAEPFGGDLSRLKQISPSLSPLEVLWLARHLKLQLRPPPAENKSYQAYEILRQWPYSIEELVKLQVKPGWMHQRESVLSVPTPPWRYDTRSMDALRALTGNHAVSEFFSYWLSPPTVSPPSEPMSSNGWAKTSATAQTPEPPRPLEQLTLSDIYQQWQELATWTELWIVQQSEPVSVQRSLQNSRLTFSDWLQQLARARRFVTRILKLLHPSAWYDFESLLKFIFSIYPDFLRGRALFPNLQPTWWLNLRGKKVDLQRYEYWRDSYGLYVEHLIRGPLLWLGGVRLAQATDTSLPILKAFQITPIGFALLHNQALPARSSELAPLHISDDLHAKLPLGRYDIGAYQILERCARFERIEDLQAIYHFDARHALAAFESGYTANDVVANLERLMHAQPAQTASTTEEASNGVMHVLPQRLRDQWYTWWANYAQVRWYDDLTLIEFADDYALQELLTHTDLRDHLLFTFSPRLIAIHPDSAEAFARQLTKKGYTPKLE